MLLVEWPIGAAYAIQTRNAVHEYKVVKSFKGVYRNFKYVLISGWLISSASY